ncbi:MAG: hypothetical protein NVV70_16955 [Cellulomonas sp.]|nr:hypothetical protein [Cellulomonas sp.]MCR6649736.1 hypothetical protein [Cellulomonas sp.]
MTPRLSDAYLAQIAAREQAATPGPLVAHDLGDDVYTSDDGHGWWWVWREEALPYYGGVLELDATFEVTGADGKVWKVAGAVGQASITDNRQGLVEKADAEFFAHARTDVPALLREVKALRGERDVARAAVEAVRALHVPNAHCDHDGAPCCEDCEQIMPCATIRALDGETKEDDRG